MIKHNSGLLVPVSEATVTALWLLRLETIQKISHITAN